MLLAGFYAQAETLRLSPAGQWQPLASDAQGKSALALSEMKQKIVAGDKAEALAALEELKNRFPEYAGPDMDAYIEAETLYAKRNWSKATKKFQEFIKTWPESPFADIATERLYSIGSAFLQGQKRQVLGIFWISAFDNGVEIMRNLADRMGTGPMGLRSLVTLAEAYEKRKMYPDAYEVWSEIADKWPTGDVGEHALLRMAKSLHAAYKGPQYDPTWLVSAKAYYEDYISRYPANAQQIDAQGTVSTIIEQQAYKNYTLAQYYNKTDQALGANLYYQYVLDTWPDSQAAAFTKQKQANGYKYKRTFQRKMFDAGNVFLDSWFGIGLLFGSDSSES